MTSPVIEILVGHIASGKSSYCQQAANAGKVILNDDAIVLALHAGNYQLYNDKLKYVYKAVENTVIQAAIPLGMSIIIDRPNLSIATRRRYIGLAHSLDCRARIVHFKCDSLETHAYRRWSADSRGNSFETWLNIVKAHAAKYEPPTQSIEHFDEYCLVDGATSEVIHERSFAVNGSPRA